MAQWFLAILSSPLSLNWTWECTVSVFECSLTCCLLALHRRTLSIVPSQQLHVVFSVIIILTFTCTVCYYKILLVTNILIWDNQKNCMSLLPTMVTFLNYTVMAWIWMVLVVLATQITVRSPNDVRIIKTELCAIILAVSLFHCCKRLLFRHILRLIFLLLSSIKGEVDCAMKFLCAGTCDGHSESFVSSWPGSSQEDSHPSSRSCVIPKHRRGKFTVAVLHFIVCIAFLLFIAIINYLYGVGRF